MKIKLQTKAVLGILLMAAILCGVSVFISYGVHAKTMDRHYKQLAGNIAKTSAIAADKESVKNTRKLLKIFILKILCLR